VRDGSQLFFQGGPAEVWDRESGRKEGESFDGRCLPTLHPGRVRSRRKKYREGGEKVTTKNAGESSEEASRPCPTGEEEPSDGDAGT